MKNWIKILTLAGFVLGGLAFRSSVFASYVQNYSDAFGNFDSANYSYEVIRPDGIPLLGTFTGVTTITITVDNTYTEAQTTNFSFTAVNSNGLDICSPVAYSDYIPVGISDVTFTFNPANCPNFTSANMVGGNLYLFPESNGVSPSYNRSTLKVAVYTASCLNPQIDSQSGFPVIDIQDNTDNGHCPPQLKIAINGNFPPPITYSFTEPINTNVVYYQPITFGGICVNDGEDQLSLTFARNDGSIDSYTAYNSSGTFINQYTGVYDIACNSGTWTKTIGVSPSVVAAILVNAPGTTNYSEAAMLGLYVTADGRAPNFLSFDDVMTHLNGHLIAETNDFNDWLLDYEPAGLGNGGITSTSTKICVNYGIDGSSTPLSQDCSYNFPITPTTPYGTSQFLKETPLPMGNYWAYGFWEDNDTAATLATTTEWNFSVVYSTTTKPSTTFPNGGTPASAANSSNSNGNSAFANPNCNQGNIIVSGICSVAVYLFMPKNSDLTQFNGLFNNIKNKPPFGYFTATQLAISGLATSTPAIMLAGVSLLGVFFSPIRIGFTLLIYFLAGLFIFNRLRHFNFQS